MGDERFLSNVFKRFLFSLRFYVFDVFLFFWTILHLWTKPRFRACNLTPVCIMVFKSLILLHIVGLLFVHSVPRCPVILWWITMMMSSYILSATGPSSLQLSVHGNIIVIYRALFQPVMYSAYFSEREIQTFAHCNNNCDTIFIDITVTNNPSVMVSDLGWDR